MRLYGTTWSPYTRRVRIVARELSTNVELVDTSTEEGERELRAVSPLRKVPVIETNEGLIYDSHVIIDWLLARYGHGNIRPLSPASQWRERNIMTVIDGALESAMNRFYLRRDGEDVERIAYMKKQHDRAASAMTWLESELDGAYFTGDRRIGLSELFLATALDWLRYRNAYMVSRHKLLMQFIEAHRAHPSFAATAIPL
jgi:glutathione S-transferase